MAPTNYYFIEVEHKGLHKYRVFRHRDWDVVNNMAEAQKRQWDEIWQKRLEKETRASNNNEKKEVAANLTREAKDSLDQLSRILVDSLTKTSKIDWERLKDQKPFRKKKPVIPEPKKIPVEPLQTDAAYFAKVNFFERLFLSRKRKEEEAQERFKNDHEKWEKEKQEIETENLLGRENYKKALASWNNELEIWKSDQQKQHENVREKKEKYLELNKEGILEYCELVLSNSEYPDWFPKLFDLEYNPDTKTLIVEYNLPDINSMPRTNDVKYIMSSGQFKESSLSESAANKLYDSIVYQTALKTIYELFESDVVGALDNIALNGRVTTTDLGTGQRVSLCIVSII